MDARHQNQSLQGVYSTLSAQTRADGKGKIYVFSSPNAGAGTSYVARNLALIASGYQQDNRPVLLLDMDLQNNSQSKYFQSPEAQAQYGASTGPFDATFGTVPFWRVTPAAVNEQGQALSESYFLSLNVLENIGLSYSQFHWENFRDGQNVHIQNARPYWHALRDHFSAIFVDTPALERADILNTVCAEADTTILVSDTTRAKERSLSDAMNKITVQGGHCAGVILNDGEAPKPVHGAHYE